MAGGTLYVRDAGKTLGLTCRFVMHPCCELLLKKPMPDMRVRRTHHGKSDDFPRWVLRKLDLEIKFSPAYPASVF